MTAFNLFDILSSTLDANGQCPMFPVVTESIALKEKRSQGHRLAREKSESMII